MSVDQTQFRQAILNADLPVPDGLQGPGGAPAGRRFSVYRNNVAVSLTEALRTAFPVVRKLVGDAFFDAMAGLYLRAHPPHSPLMMHYGQDMPAFLTGFEPVQHLGYLPDVARLELAMRASYHAADTRPVDPAGLQALSPDALVAARLRLSPATILLHSDWPLFALWAANMKNGPKPEMRAEPVLILRREFDPEPHRLSLAQARFVGALQAYKSLDQALEEAGEFDFAATLTLLLSGNAITRID